MFSNDKELEILYNYFCYLISFVFYCYKSNVKINIYMHLATDYYIILYI